MSFVSEGYLCSRYVFHTSNFVRLGEYMQVLNVFTAFFADMEAGFWLPGPLFDEHAPRSNTRGLVSWTLWSKHLSPCNRCQQGESRFVQPFRLTRIIIDLEGDFAVDPTDGIYCPWRLWSLLGDGWKWCLWIVENPNISVCNVWQRTT